MKNLTEEQLLEVSGNWTCKTMYYGAYDTGTRTIYNSPIPLWHEVVTSGHPYFGERFETWTVWPKNLPSALPKGAKCMDDKEDYIGPYIEFADEMSALEFILNN